QYAAVQKTNKRFVAVRAAVTSSDLLSQRVHFLRGSEMPFGREIKRAKNAAIDRNEMRCELNNHWLFGREAQLLLDLRQMPMLRNAIGTHAFIALDEQIVRLDFSSRATDAAQRIGDDPSGLNDSSAEQ